MRSIAAAMNAPSPPHNAPNQPVGELPEEVPEKLPDELPEEVPEKLPDELPEDAPNEPPLDQATPAAPIPPPEPTIAEKLASKLAARQAALQAQQETAAASPAGTAAPPPSAAVPAPSTARALSWNLRLLGRWLRPRLINLSVWVIAGLIRLSIAIGRFIFVHLPSKLEIRERSAQLARALHSLLIHLKGWSLWQWRDIKQKRDKRLAVFGLLGVFLIPLILFITLSHLFPPEDPVAPYIDNSVPVPAADFIDASPSEDLVTETAPIPTGPVALSPANFSFELFARRSDDGHLQLLSQVAQHYMKEWYPPGTPAVQFMRFFGEVMQRAGSTDEATLAARQRCLSMPGLRVFTERTVTCTYGHALPQPLARGESPQARIFWIVALSYDRAGRITDLRIHARLTRAAL